MIPLQSHSSKYTWLKRTLPTSSDTRGVAKATYADRGSIFVTTYVETSNEVQRLYGITDGTLWSGFIGERVGVSVGDRLRQKGRTFEILSVYPHTATGRTLTMKEIK